jgi:hypothetical protein
MENPIKLNTTMYNAYDNKGGFKMINIKYFCMAQKLIWFKKLIDDNNFSDWKTLLFSVIQKHGGNFI